MEPVAAGGTKRAIAGNWPTARKRKACFQA